MPARICAAWSVSQAPPRRTVPAAKTCALRLGSTASRGPLDACSWRTAARLQRVADMSAEVLVAWLTSIMVLAVPPRLQHLEETEAAAVVRYQAIAHDLHSVVWDPDARLPDGMGRHRTAVLLLSIMVSESGLQKAVDEGRRRGGGVDTCLLQVRPSNRNHAEELRDRRTCIREGLRLVRQSFSACRSLPFADRLSAYTSGSCHRGRKASRVRIDQARRMWRQPPTEPPTAGAS